MLHQLKLKNFRQHKDTVLEFIPGVNTIVGLNNSGKSTLPEAIEFALYGSRALRDTAKGFIADNETDGSAVVQLDLNGDMYVVGRNSKNAEVRKNKELDARYKDNVSVYMAHATGVNQTGFRLGHYVRQKELAAFSSLRPGKRFETVERMLKVNAVDKAIKKLKEEVTELDITQKTLLSAYQDVEAIENELDDLQLAHGSLCQKTASLQQDLANIAAVLASQRITQRDLLKKPELLRLQTALTECEASALTLVTVEAELMELGEVSAEAYTALRTKANDLRAVERKSIAMAASKLELDKLDPVRPKEVAPPKTPSREEVAVYESRLKSATAKQDAFKRLEDMAECHVCHQDIGPAMFKKILDDLIAAVAKEQSDLTAKLDEYNTELAEYVKLKPAYDSYLLELRTYEADLLRQETLLKDYIEVNFNPEEIDQLDNELVAMQKARESWAKLDEKRAGLVSAVSEKADLQLHIDSLLYLSEVADDPELDGLIEENVRVEKELNNQLNVASSEQARTEGRTVELNRLITQMKETRESINANYSAISTKKAMQDNFVLFKRHLTSKIRPLLQQVAETLFHKTTQDRYAAFNLSSDYEITLTTHLGFVRKLSTISGSENDLACLCLRLAIATLRSTKLAGSLGFIILDEISGSFDNERTKQTLEGLLELKDVIPQIINITHKEVEMKYADRLFTVKESNGVSTVTYV